MSTQGGPPTRSRQFIRLPGPSAREIEEQVAEYVEDACRSYDGRDLGERTRQDKSGEGQIRVDFTYDSVRPPVALEVTSLVDRAARATGSELLKLEAELDHLVLTEGLGEWMLGVLVDSDLTVLKPLLVDLLHDQGASVGIALFRSDEMPKGIGNSTMELLVDLFDAGLVSVLHTDRVDGVSIFPPVTYGTEERGFGDLLEEAIDANAQKLTEARPRETHLAVYLEQSGLSAQPSLTPPPSLPTEIDVLWILLGYYNAKYTYRLWRTTAGGGLWQLFNRSADTPRRTEAIREERRPR